jgi:UDP-MurNAc hydroxylase
MTVMRATSLGHAGILIETRQDVTIVCDPWFVPAFFGSWFVFPRNDQLDAELMARVERPDFLYISHLHGDHFDEAFLATHIDRSTPVLLPGYPTGELERAYRRLGFTTFVHTDDGRPLHVADGVDVTIHIETSITDGPGGDSALVVYDGETRLLDQNDCRLNDLAKLAAAGPIDQQWLQYSGAIWYPMVYDMPEGTKRELARAKVESQFSRAMRYVEAVGARVVVPSAGPPCFLDPDLFGLNVVKGDELSIFPDATEFVARLEERGVDTARVVVPGGVLSTTPDGIAVDNPAGAMRPYEDKAAYLDEYQADWAGWLDRMKASWPPPGERLLEDLQGWWQPLLAQAPNLRTAVGANVLIRTGDLAIVVDFPNGEVRAHHGEPFSFSFDIPRALFEEVVARRAVDWSNSLFLSCRFRAWRAGEFNEFLYNFLKSLSDERIVRAEIEARAKVAPPDDGEEIVLDGYVIERWCPHRKADLSVFGEVCDGVLTCSLHGWRFDLESGACLTAADRSLRVRKESSQPAS